jgi:hypothetical protein
MVFHSDRGHGLKIKRWRGMAGDRLDWLRLGLLKLPQLLTVGFTQAIDSGVQGRFY